MSSLATVVPGLVSATDNPVADFSDTPWWLSLVKAVLLFVFCYGLFLIAGVLG